MLRAVDNPRVNVHALADFGKLIGTTTAENVATFADLISGLET